MSRIELLKMFKDTDINTFNLILRAYDEGREDEKSKVLQEIKSKLTNYCDSKLFNSISKKEVNQIINEVEDARN